MTYECQVVLPRPPQNPVAQRRSSFFAFALLGVLALGPVSCGQPKWSSPHDVPDAARDPVDAAQAGNESGKAELRDAGDGSLPQPRPLTDASAPDAAAPDSGSLPPPPSVPQADPGPDCTLTPSACKGPCSGSSCAPSCVTGARRCTANNVAERCDNGTFKVDRACPFLCTGEGLCTGECAPGAMECTASSSPGSSVRKCGDDARWAAPAACHEQTCVDGVCSGECEVSQTRCNVLGGGETCSASGQWVSGSTKPCAPVPNFALGAVVESSSTITFGTWSEEGLVDGRGDTGYSTAIRAAPSGGNVDGCADWVSVTMPNDVTFSKVVLSPRTDVGNVGFGFPRDFKLELWDGERWVFRLHASPAVVRPSTPQVYTWGQSDKTSRVRICAVELGVDEKGAYLMQFAELLILP